MSRLTIADYPSIPFEHHLHEGFAKGKSLIIRGRAEYHRSENDSFSINLGVDPDHHEHIALHINPRHGQHKIVLNTLIAGDWGKEEHHKNKIDPEQHFELIIRAHDHHYHIELNGHHLGDYKYRIPAPMVNHVHIEGGVHIETVELETH